MTFIPDEIQAIEQALPAVGQHVASTGIGAKAFNDLTKEEALGLVANCVKAFRVELEKVFDANDVPF